MIALLAALACGTPSPPPATTPSAARTRAPDLGTVRDAFGINEPVVMPNALALSWSAEERTARIGTAIEELRDLGVRHVRLHSALYPFLSWSGQAELGDRSHADRYLTAFLAAGIDPVVMIGPWPGNATARFTNRYVPEDLDAYAAWVTETVERYDGDGVADAPGLVGRVTTWEVDNEPDLHNFRPPRGMPRGQMDPRTFCRPAEFSLVVARTAVAIRGADPTAVVLPGGLWKPFDRPGAGYGRALCASSAFLAHIDGMNVHAYPPRDPGLLWVGVDNVASCGKPVWVTEFSTSSVGADRTEHTQATELLEALLEGLRRGTIRIYWHSLTEPPTFYDGGAGPGMRGRHLRVGAAEDVDRTGPHPRWRATHRKLAAWALRSFLARYGDLPRGGIEEVDVGPGGKGVQLGDDIVAWGTTAALPGDHLVTPLVGTATADGSEPQAPVSARVTGPIDLSRGPVRVSPD